MVNKLIAYLGFANKSGQLLFGVDNIEAKANKVKLAVIDNTLAENSVNKIKKYAKTSNFKVVMLIDSTIEELMNKNNCKALGITSKDLAKAIENLNILKEV